MYVPYISPEGLDSYMMTFGDADSYEFMAYTGQVDKEIQNA